MQDSRASDAEGRRFGRAADDAAALLQAIIDAMRRREAERAAPAAQTPSADCRLRALQDAADAAKSALDAEHARLENEAAFANAQHVLNQCATFGGFQAREGILAAVGRAATVQEMRGVLEGAAAAVAVALEEGRCAHAQHEAIAALPSTSALPSAASSAPSKAGQSQTMSECDPRGCLVLADRSAGSLLGSRAQEASARFAMPSAATEPAAAFRARRRPLAGQQFAAASAARTGPPTTLEDVTGIPPPYWVASGVPGYKVAVTCLSWDAPQCDKTRWVTKRLADAGCQPPCDVQTGSASELILTFKAPHNAQRAKHCLDAIDYWGGRSSADFHNPPGYDAWHDDPRVANLSRC